MGKRTAQKDITSDAQVNSYFPYRWSPSCHLFLPICIFIYNRKTINNDTPHLKSPKKKQNKKKTEEPHWDGQQYNYWGALTSLRSTNPRPWFCLGSSDKTIKTKASHHKTRTNHSKTLNIYFYLFSMFFFNIKHDREQSGQLCRWPLY